MYIKETLYRKIFNVLNITVMVILMILTLYPLLYVLFASLSNAMDFIGYQGKLLLWPINLTFEAYSRAFQHPAIARGFVNTVFIVVVGTAISLFLTLIGAFFLSRKGLLFKKPISFAIVFTMYFSGGLIPFYLTVQDFSIPFFSFLIKDSAIYINLEHYKIMNTLWALIIPTAINTYNMIVMRTGFYAIPDSIEDSARIDGAGNMCLLTKILAPLLKPTIAVIVLYYGVAYWNAWFNASIFLQSPSKFPLQLVLRQILINNDTSQMSMGVDSGSQFAIGETLKYAVIIIATVPVLGFYPFLQKYFIKGVMVGAVKG